MNRFLERSGRPPGFGGTRDADIPDFSTEISCCPHTFSLLSFSDPTFRSWRHAPCDISFKLGALLCVMVESPEFRLGLGDSPVHAAFSKSCSMRPPAILNPVPSCRSRLHTAMCKHSYFKLFRSLKRHRVITPSHFRLFRPRPDYQVDTTAVLLPLLPLSAEQFYRW